MADAKVHDGRFANNAWLQELPEPVTKLTWDNVALISKTDADALHVTTGDILRVENAVLSKASIEIPVIVMPGQAIGCITIPLGYGRTHAGRIGNDVGVSAYPIRDSSQSYVATGCAVTKTGKKQMLATTQLYHLVDSIADFALRKRLGDKGQPGLLVHEILLEEFIGNPKSIHGEAHEVHSAPLFDKPNLGETSHQWAMSIDLNACIGCSGCIFACQAENNIPVVGKENVATNREMHWLRIDRYFKGDVITPDMVHVPTACAHCENAPCEQVCPVAATVHDSEGLNAMIYNRCIGTRYCANNCPLKVRRFNYFDFHATDPREPAKPWLGIPDLQPAHDISTLKKMVHNPEVTVRMRGVMEKCTYCVQRIAEARITAKNEFAQGARDSDVVRDGDITLRRTPTMWYVAMTASLSLLSLLMVTVGYLLTAGVGVWGNNNTISWGFPIVNFVFWVGIGHAGTLISAILFLLRQNWRTGINRFAEAMTIFAVCCAAIFPGLHVGRIWMTYWLIPYPNELAMWPQARSPLLWDVFAVGTYATVSLLFWYMGMIPDLATLRDRATGRRAQMIYGFFSLGWTGSIRHWMRFERAYLLLAALATPLVLSVHSVVSFDFATSQLPGWHTTIFPPYFVAGAVFGGFAMVLTLSIPAREWFGLSDLITHRHIENMAKVMLGTGMIVSYAYSVEFFTPAGIELS